MVKQDKKGYGVNGDRSVVSVLTTDVVNKINEQIDTYDNDTLQQLKANISSASRKGQIKGKLSNDDIVKLLNLINKRQESYELYKEDELRPKSFSKTVTIFDVYETDEENFQPYTSPIAIYGTLNNNNNETELGDITSLTNTQQETEQEDKGLLGMFGF